MWGIIQHTVKGVRFGETIYKEQKKTWIPHAGKTHHLWSFRRRDGRDIEFQTLDFALSEKEKNYELNQKGSGCRSIELLGHLLETWERKKGRRLPTEKRGGPPRPEKHCHPKSHEILGKGDITTSGARWGSVKTFAHEGGKKKSGGRRGKRCTSLT